MSSSTTSHSASLTNHKASVYRKNANFVYSDKFTDPLFDLLDAKPGQRIVDLGCGSGELTVKLGELVGSEGLVVGIDSSPDMLENAQKLNAQAENIVFAPSHDIQTPLPSSIANVQPNSFNSVFSNAVLHWCNSSPAGVLSLCRSLLVQDGSGKLVVEMGGGMNMIGIRSAIWQALKKRGVDPKPLDPWYFPRVEEHTRLLRSEGFEPLSIALHPRPTRLPTSLYGWLQTFARRSFLASFSETEAEEIMREVEEVCAPDCRYEEVDEVTGEVVERWETMYVRLRFVAVLKKADE
ncbi:hypothetical protein QFC20_004616 [Naganishia adeliensis]|uniref:Uncharacterized protein n=1 Tax=Naganishia adeliensis TaxID=92952 RepID=A0ACC2VYN3_9TREE|nr:hypothetical protein QFC20_004616 [Naganishia adeliensis]